MTESSQWVSLAEIARPHALRGAVLLNAHTREPSELLDAPIERVFLRSRGKIVRELVIESIALHKGRPYVFFEGVTDRNQAEEIAGMEIVIPAEELWEDEGRLVMQRLEGLALCDRDSGEPIGEVLRAEQGAAHDYLVIKMAGKEGEGMLPMVPQLVQIDLDKGKVFATVPEGLFDL